MVMTKPIRIMVVDDFPVVRSGLIDFMGGEPDIEVVAQAGDGIQAEYLARELQPDIILMDIYMPRQSGLETLKHIKESFPEIRVLMITMSEDEDDLFAALQAGASGFILKSEPAATVLQAVRSTAAGDSVISPPMTARLVKEFRQSRQKENITSTERTLLSLLAGGITNNEIAAQMFISESTVRSHISRMMEKLKLRNRAALMLYAAKHFSQN